MLTPHDTDVLVVGAGPVGLVLACELARRDVAVRLIDKRPAPTTESRAILVHARSLEQLERVGVLERLLETGIATRAAEFHAGGRSLARVALDTVDSPFSFSLTTAQTETERVLIERLAELGVAVEREAELVALAQDADAARATLRHHDGREEVVSAAYVAGTDGSHSTVRHQLGLRLEGSFVGERFLLGDVEAGHDLDRAAMHMFAAPDGPLLVFPMAGARVRVIAQVASDQAARLEALQAIVDERADGALRLREAHWLTTFEIHHAQVPAYRRGRVFLAGDAAHVHSPAGGQGMNTGMQDAMNLGWKLALAAAGHAADGLLDSYDAERRPVAARVIAATTRLTALGTVASPAAQALRNHALHVASGLAPLRHRIAAATEETDIAYRDSPVVVVADARADGPRPGDAAPNVPGLSRSLHQVLAAEPGHVVLHVPGDGAFARPVHAPGLAQVLVTAAPAPGAPFDVVMADPDRRAAQRYGAGRDGALIVVRPDGYIGLRARPGDDAAVAAYLARVMRPGGGQGRSSSRSRPSRITSSPKTNAAS